MYVHLFSLSEQIRKKLFTTTTTTTSFSFHLATIKMQS